MVKQNLFPYYAETLSKVPGIDVLNVDDAAMLHFVNVGMEQAQELKYPHRIDALIMIVCLRGEISFSSHMNDYTLKENQFFFSTSSVFQFHSIENCEFYAIAFTNDFLSSMNFDVRFVAQLEAQLRGRATIVTVTDDEKDKISRFFTTIYKGYSGKKSEYMDLSIRHIFCSIIYRISDAVLEDKMTMSSSGVKERSSEYFEKLMGLLSEHYHEQRNVEFYAEKMHISAKHLSRVIRNFTGKSVHQWIDEFVALEIKNLLKYSSLSIQQISYSLNFPNPSFMGQYFKRITGMTPGEYKKS